MGDLFPRVKEAALRESERLVSSWLPAGVRRGHEWLAGDLSGGPGESLSVNLNNGKWGDFANPELRGLDLISLYAAIRGYSGPQGQLQAAKELARELGVTEDRSAPASAGGGRRPPGPGAPAGGPSKPDEDDGWQLLRPAPADAPDWRAVLDHRRWGRATMHWCYRDAAGALLMVVARWDAEGDKQVRQFTCWKHLSGRVEWRLKWIDRPRPLYQLDQLAARPDALVIITEGEKAADAAQRLVPGSIATTSPGGASNGQLADWFPLKGRRVVLWPDADETRAEFEAYAKGLAPTDKPRKRDVSGSSYAGVVADHVGPIAAEITHLSMVDGGPARAVLARQLGLADLPRGFDAADIPTGAAFDFLALCGASAQITKAPPPEDGGEHQLVITAIDEYLGGRGLAPDALDGWRHRDTWALANEDVASLGLDFAFDYRHVSKITLSYVTETLDGLARRRRTARRRQLIGAITAYHAGPEADAALRAWVRAVTGDESELDVAVMRHWLWNTKRMALGLPTAHDLMPVIYGKDQGSGKTTAVERLVAPLAELAIKVDVSYLTDDRRCPVLASAIVGRWEEMQGSQRADLEALKSMLTSPTVSYRPMRTTQTVVLPRSCNFIGTSNLPVDAMVQDTTGNRRFVQIPAGKRCDWDVLNTLDAALIWRAVDPRAAAPINPVIHLLQVHQAGLVHRDPVSMWLDAETWDKLKIVRSDSDQADIVPAYNPAKGEEFEDLAQRFAYWCRTVHQTPPGAKVFGLRLSQEGFSKKQVRQPDGSRPWFYFRPAQPASVTPTPTPERSQTSTPPANPASPDDEPPW